jgi:hypothetical protein
MAPAQASATPCFGSTAIITVFVAVCTCYSTSEASVQMHDHFINMLYRCMILSRMPFCKHWAFGASILVLMLHCAASLTCPALGNNANKIAKDRAQKLGSVVEATFSATEGKCSSTSDCFRLNEEETDCPTCCIKATPIEKEDTICGLIEWCDGAAFCLLPRRRSTTCMKMLIATLGGHQSPWLRVESAASHPMISMSLKQRDNLVGRLMRHNNYKCLSLLTRDETKSKIQFCVSAILISRGLTHRLAGVLYIQVYFAYELCIQARAHCLTLGNVFRSYNGHMYDM